MILVILQRIRILIWGGIRQTSELSTLEIESSPFPLSELQTILHQRFSVKKVTMKQSIGGPAEPFSSKCSLAIFAFVDKIEGTEVDRKFRKVVGFILARFRRK